MESSPYRNEFGQAGPVNFAETADAVFYAGRVPVQEALFIKGENGWRVVIGTLHENHTVNKDYIKDIKANSRNNVQAANVTISSLKPIPIFKTGDDATSALPFDGNEKDKADFIVCMSR
jgi:hypothetical protein